MAELPSKRLKSETVETSFFEHFLQNKVNQNLIKKLRSTIPELRSGYSGLNVSFLRVLSSNAAAGESFSSARLHVQVIKDDLGSSVLAPIAVFFLQGLYILEEFLDVADPKIPEDMMKRRALRDLLQFLTEDHSALAEYRGKGELEWKWAVRFAQHLLIPLVPHKTFVIDSYNGLKLQLCCPLEHPVAGEIGDTSFGCNEGWHGAVDILIKGKEIPLSVVGEKEDSDSASVSSDSSIEVKRDRVFTATALQQVMAQTIVFSFLQRKLNGGKSSNCLVPGIGICSEQLILYMYDCEADVLLEAMPLDIFSDHGPEVLHIRGVVVLWLLLNYGEFGNCIPDKFKTYKSEFHQDLGEKFLDIYMNKVVKPCHVKPSEKNEHQPDWLNAICCEYAPEFYPTYLPKTKLISLHKP